MWKPTLARTHTRDTREPLEDPGVREDSLASLVRSLGERAREAEGSLRHRTFSGVMSGVMYVVTAVVYTLR